jgi:YVTN family beta-propeller protein
MLSHSRRYVHACRAMLGCALASAFITTQSPAQQPAAARTESAAMEAITTSRIGPGLYEIVASNARNAVYVASAGTRSAPGGTIYVLDPVTLAIRDSIDVSSAPAYGLGLNDRTQMLYTSNTRDGSVWAIDLKTGRTIARIADPSDSTAHTYRVVVDEASNTVYVSIADTPGRVWVIDGNTNTLAHVIENVGTRATGLALDAAANKLYAASLGTNEIVVVDLATRQVVSRMPSGGEGPIQLAVDTAGGRLFVTNQVTGAMSVLDTKSGELLATVKTGEGALGVGFDAGTNMVYVANRRAGTVTVVDATSYSIVSSIDAGTLPNTVAIDAKSHRVYVTNKARAPQGQPMEADTGGDTVTLITP